MNDRERYKAALHAMQSGVAAEMGDISGVALALEDELRGSATSPKHLRVGINAAMSDHAALVRLLIAKGLFTMEEYEKELADEMEREKARYEARLSEQHGGAKITLA